MFRADLHCHTTCSDGTLSPEELLRLAKEIGLGGISITDHDTAEGYDSAIPLAEELGLELLVGVEFSAYHGGESVHVLGYNYDRYAPAFVALCRRHVDRRRNRNRAILDLLSKEGMEVTEDEIFDFVALPKKTVYGRPHIAMMMVERGYVEDIRAAFKLFIGEGCPCYVSGDTVSVQETIDVIHKAGGKAVIAHPHLLRSSRLVSQLLEMDFDGIEGYYARMFPAREQKWIKIGQQKGWIVTGGSDFHGSVKPNIPLGCSWVREEIFRQLQRERQRL